MDRRWLLLRYVVNEGPETRRVLDKFVLEPVGQPGVLPAATSRQAPS